MNVLALCGQYLPTQHVSLKSILCGKPKRACLSFEGAPEVIRISVFLFSLISQHYLSLF